MLIAYFSAQVIPRRLQLSSYDMQSVVLWGGTLGFGALWLVQVDLALVFQTCT